jgi:hypothetical protein
MRHRVDADAAALLEAYQRLCARHGTRAIAAFTRALSGPSAVTLQGQNVAIDVANAFLRPPDVAPLFGCLRLLGERLARLSLDGDDRLGEDGVAALTEQLKAFPQLRQLRSVDAMVGALKHVVGRVWWGLFAMPSCHSNTVAASPKYAATLPPSPRPPPSHPSQLANDGVGR